MRGMMLMAVKVRLLLKIFYMLHQRVAEKEAPMVGVFKIQK